MAEKKTATKAAPKKPAAPKAEPKAKEVKLDPKPVVKEQPKVEVKKAAPAPKKPAAPKAAPKVEEKKEQPKVEVKVEQPKVEEKPIIKEEPKVEVKKEAPAPAPKKSGKMKVLFVAGEANPFIKTGGLADVAGALPKALVEKGIDARVMIPLYLGIPQEMKNNMQYIGNCFVQLSWRSQYCGVFSYVYQGVTYYFIDNEFYFKRHGIYGHYDDGERFAFFSKAILEALKVIDFTPDIIHANDWHTALVPVFLDCFYRGEPHCKNAQTVYTIHNIEFQGQYGDGLIEDVLGLNYDQSQLVRYAGCVNYMKGGIESAARVTTVSPSYANEILDPYYGYGMQDILNARKFKLSGIVNGIDEEKNNPATDQSLFKNYDINSIENKKFNKVGLQQLLGLPVNEDVPMIGMVGRLTHQKGIDLVTAVMDRILDMDVQVVILGTGDWKYENILKDMQNRYPGKLRAIINFSSDMASKIYAASDMFLMPSKFEPCGLSQMIAMRYASVPIVRLTGGLKDTVQAYDHVTGEGDGFTFLTYNASDMLYAIERAVGLYRDYKEDWNKVVLNGMKKDFSWKTIANQYIDLYKSI